MENKRKRPCEVWTPIGVFKGLFHQFGTHAPLGRPAITVAIVEDMDGNVRKVEPEHVRFTDK